MNIPRILTPIDPKGIEEAIAEMQNVLADFFPWLDHAFGKSQLMMQIKDRVAYKYPAVYFNKDTYLNMLPERKYGNYCFFIVDDPQEITNYTNRFYRIDCEASFIMWVDIKKVYQTTDIRSTERLKSEILGVVNTQFRFRTSRFEATKVSEMHENVFKEYSIKDVDQQLFTHPYAGFRIYGKLQVTEQC